MYVYSHLYKATHHCTLSCEVVFFIVYECLEDEVSLLKCLEIIVVILAHNLHYCGFKFSWPLSLLKINLLTTVVHQIPLRCIDFIQI